MNKADRMELALRRVRQVINNLASNGPGAPLLCDALERRYILAEIQEALDYAKPCRLAADAEGGDNG